MVLGAVPTGPARQVSAAETITVTNGGDQGQGTLRWALDIANNNGNGFDVIRFSLPGSGVRNIQLRGTLYVNEPVLIDGTTQPGYTNYPIVQVLGDGNISSLFLMGLRGGITIRGFAMAFYRNNAVTILNGSPGNLIEGNWIGFAVGPQGQVYRNSNFYALTAGVGIQSSNNTIRGNVISGVYNGIVMGEDITRQWSGTTYGGNRIEYNRVGTDPAAFTSAGFGNDSDGIFLGAGVVNTSIGPGNIFSGNGSTGVEIFHRTNRDVVVHRNLIGVNRNADGLIGNGDLGVQISEGASYNSVWGNIISGNGKGGVAVGTGATGNWILDNTIGTDWSQTRALGRQDTGVTVNSGGARNSIEGNVIAGHPYNGVVIADASGNGVYNNWIGQGGGGTPLPNGGFGVYLSRSSYNTGSGNAWGPNRYGNVGQDNSVGNAIS